MQNNGRREAPIGWRRALLAALLLLGCVWFIWSNSIVSSAESARRSQVVADVLSRIIGGVLGPRHRLVRFVQGNVRKIAHAVEFFVLGAVAAAMLGVLRRVTGHTVLHACFLLLCVAVGDETIQIFSGRGAMVQDILLDFAGGMAGLLAALTPRFLLVRALRRGE